MKEPIHVNDAEFEAKVLKSSTPVVVDFWAPWCGPCKMIAPVLEKIAGEHAGQLLVAKVNTDDNPEWATRLDISGIPTVLFLDQGQIKDRLVGASPAPVIRARVAALLKSSPSRSDPHG